MNRICKKKDLESNISQSLSSFMLYKVKLNLLNIYLVQRLHRGDSGRNRELSRIIKHLRVFSKNKTTQTRSYRELSRIQTCVCWCKFGVRCNLDTLVCPPKKCVSLIWYRWIIHQKSKKIKLCYSFTKDNS